MTIETAQLTEWQRLADQATPGPWCYYGEDLWRGTAEALAAHDADPDNVPWPFDDAEYPDNLGSLFHGDPVRIEDAEFIAVTREAIPALIAEVARLQDVVRRHATRIADLTTRDEQAVLALARVELVLTKPDDEQEWEHEDCRSVRRVQIVDVARVRAALAGGSADV